MENINKRIIELSKRYEAQKPLSREKNDLEKRIFKLIDAELTLKKEGLI